MSASVPTVVRYRIEAGVSTSIYQATIWRRIDASWTVRLSLNLKWHKDSYQNQKWQELSLQ